MKKLYKKEKVCLVDSFAAEIFLKSGWSETLQPEKKKEKEKEKIKVKHE